MPPLPKDPHWDSTWAFLQAPYTYILQQSRALQTEVFEARLLLRKSICLHGAAAAELFYDNARFQRQGAVPMRLKKTLFGVGGVQGLDNQAHRHRKQAFLSLMGPEQLASMESLLQAEWQEAFKTWPQREQICLYQETGQMLTRVVCQWAGVPLSRHETAKRSRQFAALFQYAAALGPKHWQARQARQELEAWLADWIHELRAQKHDVPPGSAAAVFADYRDLEGQHLPARLAAVELLNILRPTVAVSVYLVFLAHALHTYPEQRPAPDATEAEREAFVQEVRRLYPFFPAVAAVTRQAFEWRGYPFAAGVRVLLDLYGTHQDPAVWEQPEYFLPQRFADWPGHPFTLIPQGGGEHHRHHRCAGEWLTIALMKVSLQALLQLQYTVPPQALNLDWSQLPALPPDGFVIRKVRTQAALV